MVFFIAVDYLTWLQALPSLDLWPGMVLLMAVGSEWQEQLNNYWLH